MAKAKSKKITIEDALVPIEDQPYEVPENWCWVKPLSIIEIEYGKGLPTKNLTEEGYPVFGANGQIGYYSEYMLEKPMALMSCRGAYSGTMNLSPPYSFVTSNSLVMKDKGAYISERFIYYMFSALNTDSLVSGSAQPQVTVQAFNDFAVPLPPFKEQQRIVEQIERLFSKLDEAKEKAQEALDAFEERRMAILHKAFEGELTSQWRKDHSVNLNSWKNVPLKKCGRWFGGGTPTTSKKEYWEDGDIPWITSKDMKDKVIEDSLMHITMMGVENSSANYCEEPAVLFVMRSGILRRVFPVCMVKKPFTVNQDLKACVPEGIIQEYLYWYCSGYEKDIRDNCMKNGTTVESVEAKKLFDYEIRVAGTEEQKEIVNRIELLMEKEAAAYEAAEEVISKIGTIKKSILAKAFRGEF